jgi:hypothetical protein
MFSGYFDSSKSPERRDFLVRLLSADATRRLRFTVINQSGRCIAPFRVKNIGSSAGGRNLPYLRLLGLLVRELGGKNGQTVSAIWRHFRDAPKEAKGRSNKRAAARSLYQKLSRFIGAVQSDRPDVVVLWNQFNAFHRLARLILDPSIVRKPDAAAGFGGGDTEKPAPGQGAGWGFFISDA